jgi:hypothetical protein
MLCSKNISLPLFPTVYHKESESKMDIAENLIKRISKKIPLTNIMFDSWYSKKEIIKTARFNAKRVICGLKSHRNFSNKFKDWNKLPTYIDDSKSSLILIDEKEYLIQTLDGRIKGSKGKILISREIFEHTKSKHFYLFCSDTNLTIIQILRLYHIRWNIEVFHRDIKQNLGFHPFVRKETAIVRHAIFVSISYAVLRIYMMLNNLNMTIGECIIHLRKTNHTNFLKKIVEIKDEKQRIEMFNEVFINKSAQV